MGVIKSNSATASVRPFSMQDVESAAKSMLLKARLQAEQLLAAAQREADSMKSSAQEEGRREGLQQGIAEGRQQGADAGRREALAKHQQELSEAVSALASGARQLDAGRQALEAEALSEVIDLASAIARRVTRRQSTIDPAVLAANLSAALSLAVGSVDVRIAINPAQKATVEAMLPALKLDWPEMKHVELTADAGVAPGGCRVFTVNGSIDADIESQLDRVIADLLPSSPADAEVGAR